MDKMQTISSVQNPLIKTVTSLHRKKNRKETGLFIIEGLKGTEDAIKYGLEIVYIFLGLALKEKAGVFPQGITYLADEKVLKKISTTDTPCEVLTVAKQPEWGLKDVMKDENPLIVVLENIKDPGNLGTIIRTAKAAGISGIILAGDSVDIFNPKTVRATAANLWKIPVIYFENKDILRQELLKYKDFQFIATVVSGENTKNYFEVDYKIPSILLFGSEAEGISGELAAQSDINVKIPMSSEVESLNLSISAGIVFYEALLQRKFRHC